MTAVANVDTAVGGELQQQNVVISPQPANVKIYRYKRVMQHYVTNNNASTTPVGTNFAGDNSGAFRSANYSSIAQGWYNVPYTDMAYAMSIDEMDNLISQASAWRVVSCGFDIKRVACTQQAAATSGSTTVITNNFVQVPVILVCRDTHNDLAQTMYVTGAPQSTPPKWSVATLPGFCNGVGATTTNPGIATAFAGSFAAGELPIVAAAIPTSGATPLPASVFELLKGGDLDVIGAGGTYSHKWHGPEPWKVLYATNPGGGASLVNETNPKSPFYGGGLVAGIPAERIVGSLSQNMATNVIRNEPSPPESVFIRCPPLRNQAAPITINMELWIEYWLEVEILQGRYLSYRGEGTPSIAPFLATPYPTNRRRVHANIITGNGTPIPGVTTRARQRAAASDYDMGDD